MNRWPAHSIRLWINGLLLIILWLVLSSAKAASIQFGGVLPGGAVISKQVVSMREGRYIDVMQQETDFSCGAAALGTILKYAYGRSVTEPEVVKGMLKVSDPVLARERGFSLLDIKRYVETLGMRGRGYRIKYDDLERIRIPTIVLLDIRGYKHFVVLKATTGAKVYLADPALGNKSMDRADFEKGWNGIVFAVIGQGFERNTVLLDKKEPPTVRRTRLEAPLSDSELYEFGFRHADLF